MTTHKESLIEADKNNAHDVEYARVDIKKKTRLSCPLPSNFEIELHPSVPVDPILENSNSDEEDKDMEMKYTSKDIENGLKINKDFLDSLKQLKSGEINTTESDLTAHSCSTELTSSALLETSDDSVISIPIRKRLLMPCESDKAVLDEEQALQELLEQLKTPEQIANTVTSYILQITGKVGAPLSISNVDEIFRALLDYGNHSEIHLINFINDFNKASQAEKEKLLINLTMKMIRSKADDAKGIVAWLYVLESLPDRQSIIKALVTEKIAQFLQGCMALYQKNRQLQRHACTVLTWVAIYQPAWNEKGPMREAAVDLVSCALMQHREYRGVVKPALQLLLNLTHTYTDLIDHILDRVHLEQQVEMEKAIIYSLGILDYIKHKVCHLLPTLRASHGMDIEIIDCIDHLSKFFLTEEPPPNIDMGDDRNFWEIHGRRRSSASSLASLHLAVSSTLNHESESRRSSVNHQCLVNNSITIVGPFEDSVSIDDKTEDEIKNSQTNEISLMSNNHPQDTETTDKIYNPEQCRYSQNNVSNSNESSVGNNNRIATQIHAEEPESTENTLSKTDSSNHSCDTLDKTVIGKADKETPYSKGTVIRSESCLRKQGEVPRRSGQRRHGRVLSESDTYLNKVWSLSANNEEANDEHSENVDISGQDETIHSVDYNCDSEGTENKHNYWTKLKNKISKGIVTKKKMKYEVQNSKFYAYNEYSAAIMTSAKNIESGQVICDGQSFTNKEDDKGISNNVCIDENDSSVHDNEDIEIKGLTLITNPFIKKDKQENSKKNLSTSSLVDNVIDIPKSARCDSWSDANDDFDEIDSPKHLDEHPITPDVKKLTQIWNEKSNRSNSASSASDSEKISLRSKENACESEKEYNVRRMTLLWNERVEESNNSKSIVIPKKPPSRHDSNENNVKDQIHETEKNGDENRQNTGEANTSVCFESEKRKEDIQIHSNYPHCDTVANDAVNMVPGSQSDSNDLTTSHPDCLMETDLKTFSDREDIILERSYSEISDVEKGAKNKGKFKRFRSLFSTKKKKNDPEKQSDKEKTMQKRSSLNETINPILRTSSLMNLHQIENISSHPNLDKRKSFSSTTLASRSKFSWKSLRFRGTKSLKTKTNNVETTLTEESCRFSDEEISTGETIDYSPKVSYSNWPNNNVAGLRKSQSLSALNNNIIVDPVALSPNSGSLFDAFYNDDSKLYTGKRRPKKNILSTSPTTLNPLPERSPLNFEIPSKYSWLKENRESLEEEKLIMNNAPEENGDEDEVQSDAKDVECKNQPEGKDVEGENQPGHKDVDGENKPENSDDTNIEYPNTLASVELFEDSYDNMDDMDVRRRRISSKLNQMTLENKVVMRRKSPTYIYD